MRWLIMLWLLIVALCFYDVLTTSGIQWLAMSNISVSWRKKSQCVQASKVEFLAEVQKKTCKYHLDIMPILTEIGQKVKIFCQQLFTERRWNCSSIKLAPKFGKDLTNGTREQAFVYALSSAGMVHTVATLCSNGKLKSCGCSERPKEPPPSYFEWGGCGENVKHGIDIAKAFLETPFNRNKFKRDIIVRVNRHNSRTGWRITHSSRIIQCKCHGVSGACSAKTCWYSLAPLQEIATKLRMKYREAEEVIQKRIRGGMRWRLFSVSPPSRFGKDDLIYATKSPDYCDFNPEQGSYGTRGRVLCSRCMHRRIYENAILDIIDLSTPSHNYNTRNKRRLLPQRARTNTLHLNIGSIGPRLWNKLPAPLQTTSRFNSFKKKLKDFLLSK